jgi:hypothetical protein
MFKAFAPAVLVIALLVVLFAEDAPATRMHWGGGQVGLPPFSTVTFGTFSRYGNGACPSTPKCVSGDTWTNTWANDGKIYASAGDASNWNHTTGCNFPCQDANTMFSSLSDYSPSLTGTLVNIMGNWNAGASTTDNANYKTASTISVQGTLIQSLVRQCITCAALLTQGQLIKSTDYGVNWTPIPPSGVNNAQPYTSPMFSDLKFRGPAFIQYGQDYQSQTVDRSNQFVYAISPDQTTGTGNFYVGRVLISAIANLSINDWQFYQGGDGNDSTQDATNWGPIATAKVIFTDAADVAGGPMFPPVSLQYLPAFGTYILMLSWETTGGTSSDWTWHIYQGTHPWGPWSLVQTNRWNTSNPSGGSWGFYYPTIAVKSVADNGGRNMTAFAAGDFQQQGMYTINSVPVTVQ